VKECIAEPCCIIEALPLKMYFSKLNWITMYNFERAIGCTTDLGIKLARIRPVFAQATARG
jgi:hypothetical protein